MDWAYKMGSFPGNEVGAEGTFPREETVCSKIHFMKWPAAQ